MNERCYSKCDGNTNAGLAAGKIDVGDYRGAARAVRDRSPGQSDKEWPRAVS